MGFEHWQNMSAWVHKESLSDVFDRESAVVDNVKFVEALCNDLIEVLIEKLGNSHYGLFKSERMRIILRKKSSYSCRFILSKFHL